MQILNAGRLKGIIHEVHVVLCQFLPSAFTGYLGGVRAIFYPLSTAGHFPDLQDNWAMAFFDGMDIPHPEIFVTRLDEFTS